jgi:O-antigen/teichoic acid export membrane protein
MARAETGWNARRYFPLSALFVAALSCVLTALMGLVSQRFEIELLIPMVILGAVLALSVFTIAVAQIETRLISYNVLRLSVPLGLFTCVTVAWLIGSLSVELVVWLHTTIVLLAILVAWVWLMGYLPKTSTSVPGSEDRHIVRYLILGLQYHATGLLGLAFYQLDKLWFFLMGGLKEFGLYSVAFGSSRLIGVVQEAASTALFSRFAGVKGSNLTDATLCAFRLTFFPMLVLVLLLSIISGPLIRLAFGRVFEPAALTFSILMVECVIAGAGWILAQQFNADGRPGLVLLRQIIAILPLLALVPFIPSEGLSVWLAVLLLAGASIRLIVTMMIFKWVMNIAIPRILPTQGDWLLVVEVLGTVFHKFGGVSEKVDRADSEGKPPF